MRRSSAAAANRFAHWAQSTGVKRGDVVALLLGNRPELVIAQIGLAKLGAVSALINHNLRGIARSSVVRKRLVDAVEQLLFPIGLGDEAERPCAQRCNRRRHVGMAGDEDDRDPAALLVQPGLQREATHSRHADVEHQAAGSLRIERREVLDGRRIRLGRKADRVHELLDGIAHRFVIVDDEDGGRSH